jgi:transglutaminase-like putative cysteine protease
MRRPPLAAVWFLVAPLCAQAPVITPAGDPSIKSDTIYRLAMQASDQPDEPYVYLLDDGVVRVEADGRTTRTYRQIVQILTQDGVEDWAEQSFSYDASRERMRVNWVRVVKPDGSVISNGPSHQQESLSPVALSAPVYSNGKVLRVTLAGVAPGTIVDYSVTTERFQPPLPGDFYSGWSVHNRRLTRRSRFILDLPAAMQPRIEERNLSFHPRITEVRGRRVYVWATQDVPRVEPEPYAGSPDTVFMGIDAAGPVTWADIAAWYAGLARGRSALSPGLEQKLEKLLAGASTGEDSLKAVHRWVAQDIRYVSLSLGIGGYQPREPGAVFETGYGDCKDKATLFIALLAKMGITAYPVLLSSSGDADSTLPSITQFDHMIAAVVRPGAAGYRYVDLTASLAPLDVLPPDEQGSFAVVVHPDGRGETVTLPEDPVAANSNVARLDGSLTPEGMFSGHLDQLATGSRQFSMRDDFSAPVDTSQRGRIARTIANGLFPGGSGDSLRLFDGRDLAAQARMSMAIHNGRAASPSGSTLILTLPMRTYDLEGVAADLRARGRRRFPISATAVSGDGVDEEDLDLTLPEGWHARLPGNVDAASDFGHYESRYAQEGRVLHVVRRLTGARGVYPPDRVADLIAWLDAVSKDDSKYIIIERGP